MNICVNCGATNRDGARFCSVCGSKIPKGTPAQSNQSISYPPSSMKSAIGRKTVLGPAPQPPPVGNLSPGTSIPILITPKGKSGILPGVVAVGRVRTVDPGFDSPVPLDVSRLLVFLSIALFLLGIIFVTAIVGMVFFIVLIMLGLGLFCLLPILLPLIGISAFSIMTVLRGTRTARKVDFQVEDELSGQLTSVSIYMKVLANTIHPGDRVQVFGQRDRQTKAIRAYKVLVDETGGQVTNYAIQGIRPWPLWLGLLSLFLVVGYYAMQLGSIIHFFTQF